MVNCCEKCFISKEIKSIVISYANIGNCDFCNSNHVHVYNLKKVKEFKSSVGIIVLTKKVNLSLKKHATKDCSNLNHESLFKLLRKKEYEELLISKFGHLPQVKPVHYFKNCLELFKNIYTG